MKNVIILIIVAIGLSSCSHKQYNYRNGKKYYKSHKPNKSYTQEIHKCTFIK
jgi:hypothetical protein